MSDIEKIKTLREEEAEAKKEAAERSSLMDDENYKYFVEAYERNADNIRHMSDYEYDKFIRNLRDGRMAKAPWYKRAWSAITRDVDAGMMTLLGLGIVGTTAGAVIGSKLARKGAKEEIEAAKKKAVNEWNSAKESECYNNLYDNLEINATECNGIMPLYETSDFLIVDKKMYNQMASDANINIDELRKITGSDLPSTDIYPKMD